MERTNKKKLGKRTKFERGNRFAAAASPMNSEKNGIPDATPETVGRYVPRHNGVALVILLCVCVFF